MFLDQRAQGQLLQQSPGLDNDHYGQQNFPADYATEDLFSVYNRLYSHAMNQMRVRLENQQQLIR